MVISMRADRDCVVVTVDTVLIASTVYRRWWNGTKRRKLNGCVDPTPMDLHVHVYTGIVVAVNGN
jgi:nicotinamide riboside kinase